MKVYRVEYDGIGIMRNHKNEIINKLVEEMGSFNKPGPSEDRLFQKSLKKVFKIPSEKMENLDTRFYIIDFYCTGLKFGCMSMEDLRYWFPELDTLIQYGAVIKEFEVDDDCVIIGYNQVAF